MDVEQARFNMVESQIRPWDVLNQDILDLLFVVRREEYVPEIYRALAFIDMEIPLGHGAAMLAPKLEARILQELRIAKSDRILEVGTGSGHMTALLAHQGRHVHSVEIVPELSDAARRKLERHGIANVTLERGDAALGWNAHAPYDVIVLTGSEPLLPPAFQQSLRPGGRLFAVIGEPPVMKARLVTCSTPGAFSTIDLFETSIRPLRNALQPERFVF